MANQFLALSLFVMLLSFFIILNSMSNFDDSKSKPILNSLSVAFSSTEVKPDNQPNVEQSDAESYHDGDTLANLESLFQSQISGVEIKKNRLGTVMHIRVDLEKFEQGIQMPGQAEAVPAATGGDFMPTLVSLLESKDSGIPHRLYMILNIDDNPAKAQNDRPQELGQTAKKVAGYAQSLEGAGLPQKMMASGIGRGPEGTIDLYFRRYEPFNPLGKRAPAEDGVNNE